MSMRLVTDSGDAPAVQLRRGFEDTTERLFEALAVFEAIDAGSLLEELPASPARSRSQCAISMLNILRRELEAVVRQQQDLLDPAPPRR